MAKLILMRHGQSVWNLHNLFSGWVDIPLSTQGIEEAFAGGRQIKHEPIDCIFTSTLIRAQMTALLVMSVHDSGKTPVIDHTGESQLDEWSKIFSPTVQSQTIPVFRAWELNERMYGELQGLNKAELAQQYGADQVQIWRRSFDIPPPQGESLKMTAERTLPYFKEKIIPYLEKGQNVLIVAHGNSLRSIIMSLDQLSPEEIVHLELATGLPIIYTYENRQFNKKI
jgi:2,3-bisphosphoglycerate-dependent phosphoglycerate mutase